MGNVVAIEEEKLAKRLGSRKFSRYQEDPNAQYLFTGTDERGKTVYFFKMHITGLQDRLFGPFDHRRELRCGAGGSTPILLRDEHFGSSRQV